MEKNLAIFQHVQQYKQFFHDSKITKFQRHQGAFQQ
jgi:hypothetical protein